MEIILMRHGQSQHNLAKNLVKQKLCSTSVKNSPEYMSIRVNPMFKDQLLTERGIEEIESGSQNIDWSTIQLIIVSPMRRCLQTCRRLMLNSGKNIQVIAQPLLKGRLSNIWGHGSPLQALKNSYPQYNFDNLNDSQQIPWYINIMPQNKQELYKSLRSQPQNLYQNFKEDYCQFKTRISRINSLIKNYKSKLSPTGKILIISHSCVLRTITATSFNKKNKSVSQVKFKHIEPVTYKLDDLFKWCESNDQIEYQISQRAIKQ